MSNLWKDVWYKKGNDLLQEIKNTELRDDEIAIWYLGQCGFVVKQEKIIYIDPVLNDIRDDEGVSLRLYDCPFAPEQVEADYVFCTHEHIDHMAEETLKGIYKNNTNVEFLVPGACKEIVESYEIKSESIVEVGTDSNLNLPGMSVVGISTAHPVHRRSKEGKEYNLAYDIEINDIHVLHLGDTYLTDELVSNLQKLHFPHVLMIPINGGDYFRTSRNIIGNISPREAAIMSERLLADLTIPMHYDMIRGNTCNPLHFVEILREMAPKRKFTLPILGERIIYKL